MEKDCHNKLQGRLPGHQEGNIYVPEEIILMTPDPCVFHQGVEGGGGQEEWHPHLCWHIDANLSDSGPLSYAPNTEQGSSM